MSLAIAPRLSGQAADIVHGNLIQFNDNGAWCWYQDERVVVDTSHHLLFVGSVADEAGVGGSPRGGDIEVVSFDLRSRRPTRSTLRQGGGSAWYADDHNSPAVVLRPDGKALAMYAAHFNDTSSYYRVFDGTWGAETRFNWKTQRPGGVNFQTTYSNVWYLSAEDRMYNFVRGHNKSPNVMISTDMGDTWAYGGQLTANAGVGYNNGYYKYWGNGTDRIELLFTEYHPRDFNTSIYHGYIEAGQSFSTTGGIADSSVFDTLSIPMPNQFTKVVAADTIINGLSLSRFWNIDVQRYDDGSISALIKARANDNPAAPSNTPDNRLLFSGFDGVTWKTSYLCKAGPKLYSSEQDYTGLGALHPQDRNTIFISTTFDPRDDATNLGVHEIFRGVTNDDGETWTWQPVTEGSTVDNLRPVVPSWDENRMALLWWRGTYTSAQTFDAAVVGLIEEPSSNTPPMTYVDATLANTTATNGAAPSITGPASGQGSDDDRWHLRTGFGNGDDIFASSETGNGENAAPLLTRVVISDSGEYDFWVNFWGESGADWRIVAGFQGESAQIYRHRMTQRVDPSAYSQAVVVTSAGAPRMYQAYIGRKFVGAGDSVGIVVDDFPIQTGTTSTSIGNTARTWYDGVSYAALSDQAATRVPTEDSRPFAFRLHQNYPNPFNPSTRITFVLPERGVVNLAVFDALGRRVAILEDGVREAGEHTVTWQADGLPTGYYVCRLIAGSRQTSTRMLLVK